jgi:Cu/Ag efflux protein CusF
MGAMTMSFKLKDPAMAEQLKEGDKVKFTAEQKGDDLIITSIRKAP